MIEHGAGHWRCPVCGMLDGEHAVTCTVTDDGDLEWVPDDDR